MGVLMKYLLMFLFLGVSAHADACDQISGYFKTTTVECKYSHDGVNFFNEGYKDINFDYDKASKRLAVTMNVSTGPYDLSYVVDGQENVGRPMYEGDKYLAKCENNNFHIRAVFSALKKPLVHSYSFQENGVLTFQETLEGSTFIRVCELDRQ